MARSSKVPGVKHYVQNHCLESAQGHAEPAFLGVGEVWFESRGEADRTLATPEWKVAMADAATFMDMDRVVAGWAEEHQIVSGLKALVEDRLPRVQWTLANEARWAQGPARRSPRPVPSPPGPSHARLRRPCPLPALPSGPRRSLSAGAEPSAVRLVRPRVVCVRLCPAGQDGNGQKPRAEPPRRC